MSVQRQKVKGYGQKVTYILIAKIPYSIFDNRWFNYTKHAEKYPRGQHNTRRTFWTQEDNNSSFPVDEHVVSKTIRCVEWTKVNTHPLECRFLDCLYSVLLFAEAFIHRTFRNVNSRCLLICIRLIVVAKRLGRARGRGQTIFPQLSCETPGWCTLSESSKFSHMWLSLVLEIGDMQWDKTIYNSTQLFQNQTLNFIQHHCINIGLGINQLIQDYG